MTSSVVEAVAVGVGGGFGVGVGVGVEVPAVGIERAVAVVDVDGDGEMVADGDGEMVADGDGEMVADGDADVERDVDGVEAMGAATRVIPRVHTIQCPKLRIQRPWQTSYAGSMRRRAYLCAVGLPAALLGCSGESTFVVEPVDAGAPGGQNEAACAAWAATVCAYEVRCPPDSPWVSQTQCLVRSALGCESVASDPDVVFDEQLLTSCRYPDACLSSVAYLPVDCLPPGRTPVGGTCVFDEACQSKACSDVCGTCFPGPVDGGSPMDAVHADSGGVDDADSGGVDDADSGGVDDADSGGAADAIGQQRTPGAACLQGTDCQSLWCDATGHCAQNFTVIGYGHPCDESSLTQICGGDATCYGVCVPPENDGEPCDPGQGLDCLPPAVCAGDFCVFPSRTMCAGDGAAP